MKKTTLILLFTIPLLALKCNNDPEPNDPIDQLPPATQTGENTFGCLVDGEVWLPHGSLLKQAISVDYNKTQKQLYLSPINDGGYIKLNYCCDLSVDTTFIVNKNDTVPDGLSVAYKRSSTNEKFNHFPKDTITEIYFNISKLDTIERIIAGEFYFTAKSDSGNIAKITDGRFDLRY